MKRMTERCGRTNRGRGWANLLTWAAVAWSCTGAGLAEGGEFRAGAAAIDVTPQQFPVLVNGGMLSARATKATSPLYARAVVLDDGRERLAIVVVDSCMMSRPFLDEAKQLAAQRSKVRPERMLISATHTHTAPAAMGCLGTEADPNYVPYLREKLAEAIATAESRLEPARVGWATTDAADYTALRRWVLRPDRVGTDPFGNPTVRANMHAATAPENVTGESGPEDPELSMISIQSSAGRPLALLANFSMHYFSGVEALNADYFGIYCRGLEARLNAADAPADRPFVALMSHGCSGDIWRRDYSRPAPPPEKAWTVDSYAQGLLDLTTAALRQVEYRSDVDLAMVETRRELAYRTPDKQRLEWARRIVDAMGDREPKTVEEVYAREQILLHERQKTQIVLQALRIGSIAIATTPNETYALTGLKLKLQSPLKQTMVIELANGGDGYIPPPEQHVLGGYNTWAARSAGLEVQAEPKIAEACLELLEAVAGQPRRRFEQSRGAAARAVLEARPIAYWRLDELAGPRAVDASGGARDAFFEPGVVFFLEGPRSDAYCEAGEKNRSAHFAGGRMDARLPDLGRRYTVSLWAWNGMPADARGVSGWLWARGRNHGLPVGGEQLGFAGTEDGPGKLLYLGGDPRRGAKPVVGRSTLERWTWVHVALVRDEGRVRAYLNGAATPEIDAPAPADAPVDLTQWFFGGRGDGQANWEGRLDEIAVFDRPLDPAEIARLAAVRP